DRTQCLRRQDQPSNDRAAERLRHSETLDAVIKRNRELLRQHYDHDQIQKQHRRVETSGLEMRWRRMPTARCCDRRTCGLFEILVVSSGLNEKKNHVKTQRRDDEKYLLDGREPRTGK